MSIYCDGFLVELAIIVFDVSSDVDFRTVQIEFVLFFSELLKLQLLLNHGFGYCRTSNIRNQCAIDSVDLVHSINSAISLGFASIKTVERWCICCKMLKLH